MFNKFEEISNLDLKKLLGKTAILEGAYNIEENGYLKNIIKVLDSNIILILTNIYREHEKLSKLPCDKIDTILIESTFTYQNKIYDIAKILFQLYSSTGWKPKRIINTMDYGLEELFVICNKLDIDVYKIEDSWELEKGEYQLKKICFSKDEHIFLEVKHWDFNELFQGIEKN